MNKSRWPEILAISARLFREKGYRATTMEDISNELKVTKPALYYYIDTKHDLLYALCEAAITQLMEGVREIARSDEDVVEKLRKLVRLHVNMFSQQGDMTTVYLADEKELPQDKRNHIRNLSREFETIYRNLFQQAIDEGKFRELDVPVVVRAVSGMCNWLSNWYRPDGRLTTEEIADIFFDLILYGCSKKRKRQ
jgi:AcrR family transcriptional regulator